MDKGVLSAGLCRTTFPAENKNKQNTKMKKYEFRKWNLYQEWYVVEAKDEEEARKKLEEMGEDDIETSKFVGQEGETELYRTTDLGDDDEVELPRTPLVSQNALDPIRIMQSADSGACRICGTGDKKHDLECSGQAPFVMPSENPIYPEDDEDALKDEEDYYRQEMDSHLH